MTYGPLNDAKYIAILITIGDIITKGNQTTSDLAFPPVVLLQRLSLAAKRKKNNEKALIYCFLAIPDRPLLSFHGCCRLQDLYGKHKARFGGNQLTSAYERFQHILSMLELHDATVSIEDANLKFLRSLPSVWHVVATMIRGQPGLDELDFDDLIHNLKKDRPALLQIAESCYGKKLTFGWQVAHDNCKGFGIESSNIWEVTFHSGDETLHDFSYENLKREKALTKLRVSPPTGNRGDACHMAQKMGHVNFNISTSWLKAIWTPQQNGVAERKE
ncbi:hypothetical protein Tco_0682016 [Tanacetum coccineum]|uniref:Uncharacterized protein n=1 Tax=Tanacetum coccineum TaxID=301880 RepID=A0ABQ4XRL3_9ASTR